MKIILQRDGVKREIAFPFEVILGRAEAQQIINCLKRALNDEGWSYGIHAIYEPVQNTPGTPLPWAQ